jgi:hypothetical protein
MSLTPATSSRLAAAAFVFGVLGFLLWLLSYAWVPFALVGKESNVVVYVVVAGELGGFLASLGSICCGILGRQRLQPGTRAHRLASQGLAMGAVVLVLLVGLNVLGATILS